ncbi:MAG: ABC transporter permease subunit [Candidatus Nanopelagicales bacterium]
MPFHGAFALGATTNIEPVPNPWFSWEYVVTHQEQLITAGYEHLLLTLTSVALAMVIAIPLALLVRRYPKFEGPVLGLGGVLYTIPSLALISVLWPVFGLSPWTVVVALALYALLVVLRNTVVGLKGVPVDAVDAARGMGFSKSRILLTGRVSAGAADDPGRCAHCHRVDGWPRDDRRAGGIRRVRVDDLYRFPPELLACPDHDRHHRVCVAGNGAGVHSSDR